MSRALAGRPMRAWTASAALGAAALTVGLVAPPSTAVTTSSAPGTSTVNVVHGIPGVAVKVCVDGKPVVNHFRYRDTIVGARLRATRHKVRLVAAGKSCRTRAILKSAYRLAAGRNYTIVANLNARGVPNLKAYVNNVRRTAPGSTRLTVRHTAQAPAVNVWAGKAKIIRGRHFTWGKQASLAVHRGTYRVKVTLPGSRKAVIGPSSKTLASGRAYQVYAVGSPGHYRLVTVKIPVGIR